DVFLLKGLSAQAKITGRLTEIGVAFTFQQRHYLTVNGLPPAVAGLGVDDRDRAVTAFVTRRVGPLTDIGIQASFADDRLRDGSQYKDKRYTARLSRQLGIRTTLTLSADHSERTQTLQGYKANLVILSINMAFGA